LAIDFGNDNFKCSSGLLGSSLSPFCEEYFNVPDEVLLLESRVADSWCGTNYMYGNLVEMIRQNSTFVAID